MVDEGFAEYEETLKNKERNPASEFLNTDSVFLDKPPLDKLGANWRPLKIVIMQV